MRLTVLCMGAESLSLEAISALLKQNGHEVFLAYDPSLFDDANYFKIPFLYRLFDNRPGLIKKVLDSKPDIVGITVFTDNFGWAISVANNIKKVLSVPIIFGGIYPTASPEYILNHECVDMVCLGEGEYPMLELLNSMQSGNIDYTIKNIWFKKNGKIIKNLVRPLVEIEKLPLLDKPLFEDEIDISSMYMTMTAKGCPYACSYCSNNFLSKFYGKRDPRRRSTDNVMHELLTMKKRYNYREVSFYDSIFTVDKKWTLELMRRYKKDIKVPFRAISHPLCLDEDIARALKGAGCYRVQFGVQTFSENTKRKVLLRTESNNRVLRSFEICDKLGLKYSCDHMFGLPGESEEEQILAARIYSDFKKRIRITCFWTTYFPKTDMVDIAQNMGIINDSDVAAIDQARSPCYIGGSHGYVKSDGMVKLFQIYEILFRLMPLLSKRVVHFILKHKIQRSFRYLPKGITLFVVDFIVMCVKNDLSAFQYVKYYTFRIKKSFEIR